MQKDITTTRVLVINRGYTPIGLATVRDAFKLACQEADERDPSKGPLAWIMDGKMHAYDLSSWMALEVEEGMDSVGTPRGRIRVPRVIRLATFDKIPKTVVKFSRKNVITRDMFTCCFCGKRKHISNLSLDHVMPKSRGGRTEWTNVVTACTRCNSEKADRTPEEAGMPLLKRPYRPRWDVNHITKSAKNVYPEWATFLARG